MKNAMFIVCVLFFLVLLPALIVYDMMGSGGFKRMVTLTGVYAVCKPAGYDAVCFLDADSKSGGLSCIPFNGECKK